MPLPKSHVFRFSASTLTLSIIAVLSPVHAQIVSADQDQKTSEIVVTATRIRGAVDTDIPPVQQLDEKDIAAYGASSITELLTALGPQTTSGRGRGSGEPVVLLNGQRISGFRELRDLPPEAIRQVQIFPEEVALKYGYRADQRVINFILKDNFSSFNAEFTIGAPQDGGYATHEFENNLTRIGKNTRLNINLQYDNAGALTESERDIIQNTGSNALQYDGDIGDFRTLSPQSDDFQVNATWSRALAPQTTVSLNANYELEDSTALLGLPFATFVVPGSSPFSATGTDQSISRYFDQPGPLARNITTGSTKLGFTFNTALSTWRWALTGDYTHIKTNVRSNRNADFSSLLANVQAGTADPFAADFGSDLQFAPTDTTNRVNTAATFLSTLLGSLIDLPAGPVKITLINGLKRETLNSNATQNFISTGIALARTTLTGSVNIDVPLIRRGEGALGFLGDIGINGNYGLSDLSDFAKLTDYGYGLRWSPVKGLTLQASVIGDENAPDISRLGSPVLVTPNVTFFDFTNNRSVLITVISGGNPALRGEKRHDLKLSANWTPQGIDNLNILVEYFRNNSNQTTSNFPILTPEIEAAFPGRVVRDGGGQLISVDQRPVNFADETSQKIRWGLNYSGGFGAQPKGGQGGNRASGRGRGGPGGFGGLSGFGGPGGRGGPPGRWQIALYHSYQLRDEIRIAPGVPVLDLLGGSATSNLGGTPRNQLELSGGTFYKGIGLRVSGNYRSPTTVRGSTLLNNSDLRFGSLTSIDLRLFVSLDERGNLTKKAPFLKGSRIRLLIDNILNDVIDVRDQNGIVPLSYQTGYLDPKGRFFEISFRKMF